ncbi:hypothetical protein D0Y65_048451, partial [Glycine soja]
LRKSGTRTSGLKILQLLEKESNNFHILLEKLTQTFSLVVQGNSTFIHNFLFG